MPATAVAHEAPDAAPDKKRKTGLTSRPWWPAARRWLGIGFTLLVLVLLANLARNVDWRAGWAALQNLPGQALLLAGALAAGSHALYCTYDLFGRHHTRHGLPVPPVLAVGFISYAFNLNLGSLVGGVAFRYRLYSTMGLKAGTVTRVLVMSLLTNWLGYFILGSAVLLLQPPPLPPGWQLPGLQAAGAVLALVVLAYLVLCARVGGKDWQWRGHRIGLPTLRMALLQAVMSSLNWALIAGTLYVLLQGRIDYATVLGVLLLAAVAGVVTHVPAGLGVLEAVFLSLLSARVPQAELLGALLAYRALYYLLPLALASLLYLATRGSLLAAPKKAAA